jgi:hypothetical protein
LHKVPDGWRARREARDGAADHHLTVIAAHEKPPPQHDGDDGDPVDVYVLGLVVRNGVAFAPSVCPAAAHCRKRLGLPAAPFHTTLGFAGTDTHAQPKAVTDLHDPADVCWPEVHRMAADRAGTLVEYAHFARLGSTDVGLHMRHVGAARRAPAEALRCMIDAGHRGLALLAAATLRHDPDTLRALAGEGPVQLATPAQATRLAAYLSSADVQYTTDAAHAVHRHRRPKNFGRVADTALWGSGILASKNAPLLVGLGITMVINLMEDVKTSLRDCKDVIYVHAPTDDRQPPRTRAELDSLLDTIHAHLEADPGHRAVVHCLGGRGRTAVVLLAYLMRHRGQALHEAQTLLDDAGRHTTLSGPQRQFLDAFAERPWPDRTAALQADAVVMCGVPGSGKSTLAQHIAKHCGKVVRVSQDEMGRKACEAGIADAPRSAVVLVDRCNLTVAERAEWRPARAQRVMCVHMDTPVCEAAYRVEHRTGHDTCGKGGRRICEKLAATLQPPDAKREGFCRVISLHNEADVARQVAVWGLPPLDPPPLAQPHIHKFPRTQHMMNLGAASREDEILKHVDELLLHGPVWVEEKIDGANLGIRVNSETYAFEVQNRSHHVNTAYHTQFKKLDVWLDAHSADLHGLLEPPGRHVLYGEWMALRHSIHYTWLPSLFVAFDMFDTATGRFWSRSRLEAALAGTTIVLIPLIAHRTFASAREVAALVQTPSRFYDGPVEGVYVRRCDDQHTLHRAKIVRADFISGNEHWTKGVYTPNVVA